MARYYHVRISGKKNPKYDYGVFTNEINLKNEAPWDKDSKNKIKVGDYLGFIVGKKGYEVVWIYKVKSETVRETHWKQDSPYTEGNGIGSVGHREGIILTNIHDLPKNIEWDTIRKCVNFSPNNDSWMPRGTQLIKNSHLLPFILV